MKILIITIIHLICFNVFSQKTTTQYFLINKNDTLIKKQIATKKNKYEGYTIINENRIIKKYLRSSKIDEDDIEIQDFDELSFTFNRNNDTIVDELYVKKLNIIKDRIEFFKKNLELDETRKEFIFIEPIKCNEFILRKVRLLILE